jgi:hypothetical protein
MYPAAVLTTTVVCLFAAWRRWDDVTTYAVLVAVGMTVALLVSIWIEAPRRRRSGRPNVG